MTDDQEFLSKYWGKADPKVLVSAQDPHTVLGHSLDVAACAFILLKKNPLLEKAFSVATGLELEHTANAIASICALHDIGKFDTRFQRKAPEIANKLRPHTNTIKKVKYDHGIEGYKQAITEIEETLKSFLIHEDAYLALRAVCGHHGEIPRDDALDLENYVCCRKIKNEDKKARELFLKTIVDFFGSNSWSTIDKVVIQRLGGLCTIADWVGSNTVFFPYSTGPIRNLEEYWRVACERAEKACLSFGLIRSRVKSIKFSELFPGYVPRGVQELTEKIDGNEPSLIVIEAEMGQGKTEAALSLAFRSMYNGLGEGISVFLPTMATSNAMFSRVEDASKIAFSPNKFELSLAHSRARKFKGFQKIIRENDTNQEEATVTCSKWLLSKKRVLLAQMGVGTIDQALQAVLLTRHQFVKMFSLSRNIIIIDEVHAYDAYMSVLLTRLLEWMGALRVTVILLSATLPKSIKDNLSNAWLRGYNSNKPIIEDSANEKQAYPLVSITNEHGHKMLSLPLTGKCKSITFELSEPSGSLGTNYVHSVVKRLVDSAKSGAKVAWIRNTVGEAQEAFSILEDLQENVEYTLFHARFRSCDRSVIEKEVLSKFGKNSSIGGRILIATQVVEQSLDLDFDELHTDLAPIDLMFQRSGRLHRHEKTRPKGFEKPKLVVHCPNKTKTEKLKFGKSSYVYDKVTLWLSDCIVRSKTSFSIPEDIRIFIEQVYDPEKRAKLVEMGGKIVQKAENDVKANHEASEIEASRVCITSANSEVNDISNANDDTVISLTRQGISFTYIPVLWKPEGCRDLEGKNKCYWDLEATGYSAWSLVDTLLNQTLSYHSKLTPFTPNENENNDWNNWKRKFESFVLDNKMGNVIPLPMSFDGSEYVGLALKGNNEVKVTYTTTKGLTVKKVK